MDELADGEAVEAGAPALPSTAAVERGTALSSASPPSVRAAPDAQGVTIPSERERLVGGALEEIGASCLMWTFAAICSLALFSDAVERITWDYVLSSYREPVTGLKVSEMRTVYLVMLVFSGVGGLLSMPMVAAFGDRHGRRRVILLTMGFSTLPSWLCVASNMVPGSARTWYIVVLRSLAAFPLCGSLPAVSALAAELSPARWRASFIAVILLGPALASLLDTLVLRPVLNERGEVWQIERYNRLSIIGAIPLTLTFFICWLWLPDSPRWLARCGDGGAACKLVGRLARSSGGDHAALLEALEAHLAREARPPPRRALLDPARRIAADGRRYALLMLSAVLAAMPTAYVAKRLVRETIEAGWYPAGTEAALEFVTCLSLVLAPVLLDGLGRRWGLAALIALGGIANFFVHIFDAKSSEALLVTAFVLAASVALPSQLYVGAGLILRVAELAPATGARETAIGGIAAAFFVVATVTERTYTREKDTIFFITASVLSLLAVAAVLSLPEAHSSDLLDEAGSSDLLDEAGGAEDREQPQSRAKHGTGARDGDDQQDDEAAEHEREATEQEEEAAGEAEPLLRGSAGARARPSASAAAAVVDPDAARHCEVA
jgi:MFS family permease